MKQNPFIISGYISPEYFCDREQETQRMIDAFQNGRHLTLISPRRMGKTGLIKHSFYTVGNVKETVLVYLDILATTNLSEFTELFGIAVLKVLGKKESTLKKILRQLSALRPSISFNSISGEPQFSLTVGDSKETLVSLETIFNLLAQQSLRIIIAIDEFQQIINYPEKNVEAILRTYVQQTVNLTFIFSGSRKHVLAGIFTDHVRPFYNTTEIMEIGPIPAPKYKEFITSKFQQKSISIIDEALEYIDEITGMHTFYVQFLCNRLIGTKKKLDKKQVHETMINIINENESVYANYLNLITSTQFKVLRAIAVDKNVEKPTSQEFINRHQLGAASSVSQAVGSLVDKEFIFETNKGYRMNDVFFANWIVYRKA